MTIGELIHNRRKELNMTLEQVGDAVGVGKSTVRKWEAGMIQKISMENVNSLSRVLGIPATKFIFTGDILTDSEQVLIDTYRRLPENLQENLLSHAKLLLSASGIHD